MAKIKNISNFYKKIFFTLLLLSVYRLGVFITIPGVNKDAINSFSSSKDIGFFGFFNVFSGGAFSNLSVFALGVMPYISASIVFQFLSILIKSLNELKKEGEQGQKILNQYIRFSSIFLALVQAYSLSSGIEILSANLSVAKDIILVPGLFFRFSTVLTLSTGTCFALWLGEQISEKGVGNGVSLLIFSGIVADLPKNILVFLQNHFTYNPKMYFSVSFIFCLIILIVLFEKSQRRIPIFYARRVLSKHAYIVHKAHLPLRLNMAGTVPPIFASSLLMLPSTLDAFHIPGMSVLNSFLLREFWFFSLVYASFVFLFCYVYTYITFQPLDVSDNLKNQHAFIPNIRPGKQTAEYIYSTLSRITFCGALYLVFVCVTPFILNRFFNFPFRWIGTSVMILVGVSLDVITQIESQQIDKKYQSSFYLLFSKIKLSVRGGLTK